MNVVQAEGAEGSSQVTSPTLVGAIRMELHRNASFSRLPFAHRLIVMAHRKDFNIGIWLGATAGLVVWVAVTASIASWIR